VGAHAPLELPALVVAAAASIAVAFALVEMGPTAAVALALLPLLAIGAVYVMTSGQAVLYGAALALPMLPLSILNGQQIAGPLVVQDLIAALALGALIFSALLARGRLPAAPRTPVLGWPLVLFAAAILIATLRGHYEYGSPLIGQPLRLFLYSAIVAGLIGMTVDRLYRLLVVLFYGGAVLIAFKALYFLAVGGSATASSDLSTGGIRPLAIETSLYAAGALFLALLNLRLASGTHERVLHLGVAGVSLFGVLAGFGRGAYAAVAVVGLVFLLTSHRLRVNVLSLVPLVLPFVLLLAVGVGYAAPQFVDSVVGRVSAAPAADINVEWRVAATDAVLEQVREQPIVGSGFGRTTEIFIEVEDPITRIPAAQRVELGQDPHNGYVYLLAGGGIVALGSFMALLAAFAVDVLRRYRNTQDPIARLLLAWAPATLFVFLFNAASGTSFANPVDILTIWALLVLPAVVTSAPRSSSELTANNQLAVRERSLRSLSGK